MDPKLGFGSIYGVVTGPSRKFFPMFIVFIVTRMLCQQIIWRFIAISFNGIYIYIYSDR